MDGDASFGAWLRRRRKALDLTQDTLAARVGCSAATIRKIEVDARRPSRQIAELLAEVLDIPATDRPTFLRVARGERRIERLADVAPPINRSAERPTPVAPPQLPVPLTPLVGRAAEVAEVRDLLARAECRLLTIVGPGGIGKTRLAIAAATEQGAVFRDGTCFVALAPLSAPEFLIPSIAEALGLAFYGLLEPKRQLLNYLREKALLLVLDNLEHLLDGVVLLSEVLQHAREVKVLVTSRERLRLQGEWVVDLPGLSFPPPGQIEQLESYSAVTLFVQSAQRVQSDFTLSDENWAAVARICQIVEGMPLGIELATAWVHVLSCREIVDQIERNLDFLAASVRDLPERHRSLRAVIDHSWQLLTDEEREVLRRLSVFRGSFTREAAEQVTGATLGALSALVGKSLLDRTAEGRYTVHELVRQYLGRHLTEDGPDHDATYTRFSQYYADWLQRQEAPLSSAAQRGALEMITIEMDNIRAALNWAATHQDWTSLNKSLGTLFWFYEMRDRYEEATTTLGQWIAALRQVDVQTAEAADYQIALGHALAVLGHFCVRGQLDRARAALEQSLDLLRAYNAPNVLVDALMYVGVLHFQTGDYAQCDRSVLESLDLRRSLAHGAGKIGQCYCYYFLSYSALGQGRLADARSYVGEALRLLNDMGEAWATIRCKALLMAIVSAQGELSQAEHLARETLALSRTNSDRWSEAQALIELGVLAQRQGQSTEAQSYLRESIAMLREMGALWSMARALNYLGDAIYALGDNTEAHWCFLQGLRTALAAQALPVAVDTLVGIASVRARAGRTESALELVFQALTHPSSSQETQARSERLKAELETHLSPQQIEVAQARSQGKTFEAAVAEILVDH